MNFNKMLQQINTSLLSHVSSVGILPNDGGIIEGFPECALSFDYEQFRLHIFSGYFKPVYQDRYETFLFSDIKEIEMGKYNFKDHYIKITFKDDKYIAFSYLFKVRKYKDQMENIFKFIKKLESISTLDKEES